MRHGSSVRYVTFLFDTDSIFSLCRLWVETSMRRRRSVRQAGALLPHTWTGAEHRLFRSAAVHANSRGNCSDPCAAHPALCAAEREWLRPCARGHSPGFSNWSAALRIAADLHDPVPRPLIDSAPEPNKKRPVSFLVGNGRHRAAVTRNDATALAPIISKRCSVRSPIFDVAPSFCFPPVERCSGVSPNQAAKSRPFLKVAAEGANATSAVAVTGPTPGIVVKRRASSSSRARRVISTSRCSIQKGRGSSTRISAAHPRSTVTATPFALADARQLALRCPAVPARRPSRACAASRRSGWAHSGKSVQL